MKALLESPRNAEADQNLSEIGKDDRITVLHELDNILSSPSFKGAYRCKQFLRHVVLSKLDGQTERLKERVIGAEVFRRPPGYATGEDPVVRVQAGEVRRRLEQFYQTTQHQSLRIELPVGSYSPVFHSGPASDARGELNQPAPPGARPALRWKRHLTVTALVVIAILAALAVRTLFKSWHRVADPVSMLDQFWGPAIASHQPILICVANASDRPSDAIFQPSSPAPSGKSPIAAAGNSISLSPGPNGNATQGNPEIVPAADASVAVVLSGLFGKFDRPSQLRIGAAATYEDLRDFPAAVIGGFNNKWTMQLVSGLHFAFLWDHGQYMIREQVPGGRVWTTQLGHHGETVEDFAIVSRLIDSKTGQFTVTVAGIGPRGTQAAGEFVSSSRYLEKGLAGAPADWKNRNLEVLLQTTVTDSVAGPPHVIGIHTW